MNTKYNWDEIMEDYKNSNLSVKKFCESRKLNQSNFYKQKKQRNEAATETKPLFEPIKIKEQKEVTIKIKVNGTLLEIPEALIETVIRGIK